MRKNAKAGRPAFQPTAAQRRRVSILAGGGMSHEEIAIALGVARNTLEKYFDGELSVGAYKRRAEVMEAMHKAALKGNVAAQKAFVAMTPMVAAPPVEAAEPKPEKLGKKEQADVDAKGAEQGTSWEDVLPRGNVVPLR